MVTLKDRLPPALRRLGSDEWTYVVLPDVALAFIAIALVAIGH